MDNHEKYSQLQRAAGSNDAVRYSPPSVWMSDVFPRPMLPLTKQVNQLNYELPQNKYAKNAWSYAPEFIKVFSDVQVPEGGRATFDCILLGSPRPKVCWLYNDEKMAFEDAEIVDTADLCRLTIPRVKPHHYGVYTVMAENEVGRAVTTATLLPTPYVHYANSTSPTLTEHFHPQTR